MEQLNGRVDDGNAAERIVRLRGEIDLDEIRELEALFSRADAAGANRVVFDLPDVTFLDSTGISCFLRLAERGAQARVDVEVRGAHGVVHRVLEVTGLLGVPPFVDGDGA